MIIKQREKSKTLKIFDVLATRSHLSEEDSKNYQKQLKGFEGEVLFDEMTSGYFDQLVVINDFTFKINGHICQIDTLVIYDGAIEIYEVKNYEGRYRYVDNRFTLVSNGLELLDPLVQANRAHILLKQLLLKLKIKCTCESYAVFMHPNCTIYQDKPNHRVLMPSLFAYHFSNRKSANDQSISVAKMLLAHNCEGIIYTELPHYALADLRKGIYCNNCTSSIDKLTGRTCVCQSCQYKEKGIDNAVRHIRERQLLFPELPLKTRACIDWCGGIHSKYRIRSAIKVIIETNLTKDQITPL